MKRTLIIAEAGVNHNGSLDLALEMVDAAKDAGADIVKFQTAKPEKVISRFAEKAEYQKETTGSDESQLEMCKKIHLKYDDYYVIKKHCEKKKIDFLSTPFDLDSVDFLEELGCTMWKIPSGEITNLPYLEKIGNTKKPVILSTGMCTRKEIGEALEVLNKAGSERVSLLHCVTQYPTPYQDVNLAAMISMKNEYKCEVGFSDHTLGIEIPIAAVAMGATIVEKHFTMDRTMIGPDHKASLEPNELKQMIVSIRNVEEAIGDGEKKPALSEIANINIARKSIVAAQNIKKGELFTEQNITTKRPGNGISPMRWYDVIGQMANRNYMEDELIEL